MEEVKEWTDGRGADAVVLAVGVTAANDQALEMVKHLHGRILLFAAGYPAPELHVDSNLIHYRKIGARWNIFSESLVTWRGGADQRKRKLTCLNLWRQNIRWIRCRKPSRPLLSPELTGSA